MKTRKALFLFLLIVSLTMPFAFADGLFVNSPLYPQGITYSYGSQLGIAESASAVPVNAVLLAIGSADYPVTPGDIYVLSYSDGRQVINLSLQVDSSCTVSIPSIGVVDASGMTYRQLKEDVENLIDGYYTFSSPQLTLTGCGLFSVRISGEVTYSQNVTVWGLSRLSDLAPYATDYASTREVNVRYANGTERKYDLYNGLRNGSVQDNPLLAPGCEVTFRQAETIVSLAGSVKRGGVYQLLNGQSLYDLVEVYGKGLSNDADSGSITVARYSDGVLGTISYSIEESRGVFLSNGDMVNVASSARILPSVTVSGAISTNRIVYNFVEGETARQLLGNISGMLLPSSDTGSVYVLRDGRKIVVDASSEAADVTLMQGDTLVIPFIQQKVMVTGAVNAPGSFDYVPDRTADYYINLARGYSQTAKRSYKILDRDGNKLDKDAFVPADATIVAANSNMTANIAIAASVLSIVSTVLTIIINGHTIANF